MSWIRRLFKSDTFGRFWSGASKPFVKAGFQWRLWRANSRIYPIVWQTPGERLRLDLELFEDKESKYINKEFLEDLSKARDGAFERARKQSIVSMLIFIFLAANYFSINLDFSISGFSLKFSPGIREGLLLIVNILAFNTLMLQGNTHVLSAAMKHIISRIYPEELQTLYTIRYFAQDYYVPYYPYNVRHIAPTSLTSKISSYGAISFAALAILTAAGFYILNIAIVFDTWKNPTFGVWSKALSVYIAILGIYGIFYSAITRFRLPYRDYTVLDELSIMEQVHPERHRERWDQVYKEVSDIYGDMLKRGYKLPGIKDE